MCPFPYPDQQYTAAVQALFPSCTNPGSGGGRERQSRASRSSSSSSNNTSTSSSMERSKFPSVPVVLTTAMILAMLAAPSSAFNRYTIGGSKGWNPGVNYTLWNNKTHYYVGDWLVFLYQPGQVDVVQVNKTDYDLCIADNPITNYSRGRSYAFRLNHTGHFYFICSRGYCYQGMKLSILAEAVPPPAPPPKSKPSAAGSRIDSLRSKVVRLFGVAAAVSAALLQSI